MILSYRYGPGRISPLRTLKPRVLIRAPNHVPRLFFWGVSFLSTYTLQIDLLSRVRNGFGGGCGGGGVLSVKLSRLDKKVPCADTSNCQTRRAWLLYFPSSDRSVRPEDNGDSAVVADTRPMIWLIIKQPQLP